MASTGDVNDRASNTDDETSSLIGVRGEDVAGGSSSGGGDNQTMVTHSPVPSEIDPSEERLIVDCPRRSLGMKATTTTTRTNLIHRKRFNDSTTMSAQKRKLSEGATMNPDNDIHGQEEVEVEESSNRKLAKITSNSSAIVSTAKVRDTDDDNKNKEKISDELTEEEARIAKMSKACCTILECIGEDPNREGLVKTPERWAKALLFMCHGYHLSPEQVTNQAVFSENHNEMVVVKNIDIHSLCEHHMVPFTGHVHIGYIPNGQIIGLSKLARLAEMYARRLQVQERLTRQIADALVETVQPLGVAVVVECKHFCMVMRGVQKTGAITTTSSVRGCFESNPKTRAEFFSILYNNAPKMC